MHALYSYISTSDKSKYIYHILMVVCQYVRLKKWAWARKFYVCVVCHPF